MLVRNFQQQVALEGVAGAGLDAADRRVPRCREPRADHVVEPELIVARGRVETRHEPVAALDRGGHGAQRLRQRRRLHDRQMPRADDCLQSQQVVAAGIFQITAPHRLRERFPVAVADGGSRGGLAEERAACQRRAHHKTAQAARRAQLETPGDLAAAVVVREKRVRHRAGSHRRRRAGNPLRAVDLHARVPPERAHERHPGIGVRVADRITHQPAQAPFAEQLVGVGGERVGPHGREVLVRQRVADQRVVARVSPPRERAEGRRHPADLDVEIAGRPGPDAQIERIRPHAAEILRPHLAQQREMRAHPDGGRQIEPQQPQRRVLVIGVVEEAGIVRAERRRYVAADRHTIAGKRDRLRRQRLGARGAHADDQQPREPCGRAPECHACGQIIVRQPLQSVVQLHRSGDRRAAARTASEASLEKTCVISPEHGFRRCLEDR